MLVELNPIKLTFGAVYHGMESVNAESWLLKELDRDRPASIFGPDGVLPVLEGLPQCMDGFPMGTIPLAYVDAVVSIPMG